MPAATVTPSIPHWHRGVLEELHQHALADPGREVAGVLVGVDGDPPQVTGLIRAVTAAPRGRAVLDHHAWARIHGQLERRHPCGGLVGWYVSRPGFGHFLTAPEVEMHRWHFSAAGHIALVIDSV